MSVIGHLCGLTDVMEVMVLPYARDIRAACARDDGYSLVEPDLAIAHLPLPRDPVDRAVLAIVTRDRPRALAFVRSGKHRLGKVKVERALDLVVQRISEAPFEGLEGEAIHGKELLRRVRERRGSASTSDAADLGKAIVRAWSDGLLLLGLG
jgi:hypothetical protein